LTKSSKRYALKASRHNRRTSLLKISNSRDVFATEITDLPGVKDVEYNITLQPNARPTRPRQFRYPPHLREVIRKELFSWEKAGFIEEGDARWFHPIVLVRKKPLSGNDKDPPKYRICIDLREINKVTVVESYPIPTLTEITDSLGDPPPTVYSSLDALSGFLQLPVDDESSKLLGIQSDSKTYCLKRIPFGLVTSPFVYQKLMNKLLADYQYIFAVSYIDDTLIWSADFPTHLKHLGLILNRFLHVGLRLRADKCQFAVPEIRYLGMMLGQGCIKMDPDKLRIIKDAKAPTSAKLLKSFIGLCAFYRKFIRGFSQICAPFRTLLTKNAKFEWTEQHQQAFEKLKSAMTSAPICLHFPNWKDDIVLISDSCKTGCGYIICSRDAKGTYKILLFGGRMWNRHEMKWSTTELELAGVITALEQNSQYFIGQRKFYVLTDHLSNVFVQSLKHSHGKLYRWSLRLQNYNFEIQHISGDKMPADFLSRIVDKPDPNSADLDDDSALVFASTQPDVYGDKPIRPRPVKRRHFSRSRGSSIAINFPDTMTTDGLIVGANTFTGHMTSYIPDPHDGCQQSNQTPSPVRRQVTCNAILQIQMTAVMCAIKFPQCTTMTRISSTLQMTHSTLSVTRCQMTALN